MCLVLNSTAYSILLGLRTVCVDWLNDEPKDDPALRGEKDPKTGYRVELPHRKVGVSSTQVSHVPPCIWGFIIWGSSDVVIHGSNNVGVPDI